MVNSTLGGLIKDYRLQKGISQLDIAFALGWKETSRLSRIEQGRTERPPRELIDKIIRAIGLEEEEKNTLLLIGGYLPTEEEIGKIRQETKQILEEWMYPAFVFDFSWRLISFNKEFVRLYKMTAEDEQKVYKHHPRILDVLFDPDFNQNKLLNRPEVNIWKNYLKVNILNFKYEQRYRTKEKWYIDHVRRLMTNDLFRELWVETDIRDRMLCAVGKFIPKIIISPDDEKKLLHFFRFMVPILKDPRFEVDLLVPKGLETYTLYHAIS